MGSDFIIADPLIHSNDIDQFIIHPTIWTNLGHTGVANYMRNH